MDECASMVEEEEEHTPGISICMENDESMDGHYASEREGRCLDKSSLKQAYSARPIIIITITTRRDARCERCAPDGLYRCACATITTKRHEDVLLIPR
jgi:hypothetical protein